MASSDAAPHRSESLGAAAESVRILLVDDRPANLLALEAVLAEPDHTFVSVASGAEALAQLEAGDFALVLLDVQMPGMDGFETALRVKDLARTEARRVPIIFVTAIDSEPARVASAYGHGAVDFIQKPFDVDILRAKVGTFVELHRARLRLAAEREAAKDRATAGEERLRALTDLALGLSETRSLAQVVDVIIRHGTRLARADVCTLYTLDPDGVALDLIGEHGLAADIAERIRRISDSSEDTTTLRAVRELRSIWAEDLAAYETIFPDLAAIHSPQPRARAFWSMPLVVDGKPIGLLGMGFYQPRTFSPTDRSFVTTFTRHCAQALQRALLFEREDATRRWLTTTLRSIGDAVLATDTSGAVTFMNPVAERLTGWNESEARGAPLGDVFRMVADGDEGGGALLRARNGSETPIERQASPIQDEDGKVLGEVLVFRDVGDARREAVRRDFLSAAGEVLASSMNYRETLAAVARLAVPRLADWCAVDLVEPGAGITSRLAVAHVDPARVEYARKLGERYPPDRNATVGVPEVVRSGRSELYAEIDRSRVEANARDAEHLRFLRELHLESAMVVPLKAQGRTLGAMTFVYARSGRHYTPADLSFAEDFARRAALAIVNARALKDAEEARVTEQTLRAQAEVANRAKDEFLATVSHELRTPLNAILGWTVILRDRRPPPELARALGIIERNARSQATLIEDVLDVSRIISGKMSLRLGPTNLADVVDAAIETVTPAAVAKEVALRASVDRESLVLNADADRMQQVVWNLLSNAVKFSPKGGQIRIEARREGSEVWIAVSDDGEGIRADVLRRVFEPFHQGDASTTRRHGGLGLGLAIVKHLVVAHGGTVNAESEGEGKGATLTVRLPARAMVPALTRKPVSPSVAPSPADRRAVEIPSLSGLHLLVVDDEDDVRTLLSDFLRGFGATVDVVDSAHGALTRLEGGRPDVLISDIGMPGMDGYELLRAIRAMQADQGGSTPAIALTAYAGDLDVRRALSAGFQAHVAKPADPIQLARVVAELGRRR